MLCCIVNIIINGLLVDSLDYRARYRHTVIVCNYLDYYTVEYECVEWKRRVQSLSDQW